MSKTGPALWVPCVATPLSSPQYSFTTTTNAKFAIGLSHRLNRHENHSLSILSFRPGSLESGSHCVLSHPRFQIESFFGFTSSIISDGNDTLIP